MERFGFDRIRPRAAARVPRTPRSTWSEFIESMMDTVCVPAASTPHHQHKTTKPGLGTRDMTYTALDDTFRVDTNPTRSATASDGCCFSTIKRSQPDHGYRPALPGESIFSNHGSIRMQQRQDTSYELRKKKQGHSRLVSI